MKNIQPLLYIQKYYILTLLVSILCFFLFGFWGISFLDSQYTRELALTGNIAGAVLSEYPEAESTLISALQDTRHSHMDAGYSILQKYGYRKNFLISDTPCYHSIFKNFALLFILITLCELTLITVCFFRFYQTQKGQEMLLHTLLDNYLEEDYSVSEAKDSYGLIFNESFTDTLFKLGDKLMAKTQALTEERDHTKTLVTDISHQLKTPVSALKSCFTMCMEADTEEERNDFLQRCALQMNKLERLVTVLVSISRLETSLISLRKETTTLSDVLTDAVNTVYEKALQKNISIEVCEADQAEDTPALLFADRHWTAEAIANILDNAVKYSPAGSTVSLRIHRFYSYVQLEITDQGIGIPKAEYNQIFKRFYRGSHPIVKQSEGSGVGLYLARSIIEEQDGTVAVKPALVQGTIFDVHLPLKKSNLF